ncbi:hypothetical protein MCEL_24780 [Mycolicibacterium celeriflavum]|uniref:Uncharacterized protein n=1 Tax=Mycolicibacterium celeriflavum TaxID=1249101 RepID=A0A7I7RI66_MYCCF|nr:hypothetical protein MCEL_24780 [Mycolicibacterium celeriflavum]
MVRTGARAKALQSLMVRAGFRAMATTPPAPRLRALPVPARNQVVELFEILGGRTPMPPLRPGAWDLAFDAGVVVELDEELHFNRYRAKVLQTSWASDLPWHRVYLAHCRDREQECLAAGKWGKRWTNPSCEAVFGPPGAPGDLVGTGSPRWKQRALYDAVKDVAGLHSPNLRLCRLSIWDRVGDTSLGAALAGAVINLRDFSDFVGRRTILAASPPR